MKKDWNKLELGALWKKTSKDGNSFYTGLIKIDGKEINVICFPNKAKKEDKHPDVRVYLDEKE